VVAILALKSAHTPQGLCHTVCGRLADDSEQALSVEPDFSSDKMDNLS